MDDTTQVQAAPPAPAGPTASLTPPPATAAAQLAAAIDALNHPSVLDLQARIHAIQNAINVMAAQLMPLLPTE